MPDRVNPKRPYESPRRREQAQATRLEILEAAQRLFERDGYATTTMAAIATEARVALKTVYVAFDTKSGLLRALWNLRLRGGQNDVPVAEQQWYRAVLDEPDPERQLRMNAHNSAHGKVRIGGLLEVIRGAAPTDQDIGALWNRIQTEYHANQGAIVQSINDKRALKPALEVQQATDILWLLNHPNTWQLLAGERGWTADQYEQWTGDLAVDQLLAPAARAGRTAHRVRRSSSTR